MLHKNRLETQFDRLNARCNDENKPLTPRERIDKQQKLVAELQQKLEIAKEKLRLMRSLSR